VGMEPISLAVGVIGTIVPVTCDVLRKIPGGKKILRSREKREG
jgi:hypothetical protein